MMGRDSFIGKKCPVDTCTILEETDASEADAVLFNNEFPSNSTPWHRPSNQVTYKLLLKNNSKFKNYFIDYSCGFCTSLRVLTTRHP